MADTKERITAHDLASRYQNAINNLGLNAKIDEEGDVIFKHLDLGSMFLSCDAAQDPEFMMLVFPNFASKDSLGLTRDQLLLAINAVNTKSKAVKLGIRVDTIETQCDVIATIECFLAAPNQAPSEEILNATIGRNLSALRASVKNLLTEAKAFASTPAGASVQTV
ncbi:MAG: hypothetical protein V4723_17740 [Pseudomonadota bacterium]